MKTYTILAFAAIALMLFAVAPVLAEDETQTETNDTPTDLVIAPAPNTTEVTDTTVVDEQTVAEINDDLNESVSGMRIGWERVKLAFTFGDDKKAMQEFKLAKLRLIQARIAAKNGNEKAMERALEAHERIMDRVKERVKAIDGVSDNRSARGAVVKLVGLERAIEVHEARISKLNEILASENLTEEQRARIEMQIGKAQNVTASLRALSVEKMEKLKTKLRAVANMTEEEADSAIEEAEDNQHLSEVRTLVSQKRAEHQERMKDRQDDSASEDEPENETSDSSDPETEVEPENETEAEPENESDTE